MGHVYFVGDGNLKTYNNVKIGWTKTQAVKRVKDLQTANPEKLIILAILPGQPTQEQMLHEQFAKWCAPGGEEWFRRNTDLHELIVKTRKKHSVRKLSKRGRATRSRHGRSRRIVFKVDSTFGARIEKAADDAMMEIPVYLQQLLDLRVPETTVVIERELKRQPDDETA